MWLLIVSGIYPPAIGGSATYSAFLARELPKRGFEISVLTYGKKTRSRHCEESSTRQSLNNELEIASPSLAMTENRIISVSNSWPKGLRHLIYFFKLLWLGRKNDMILAADSSFGAATIAAIAGWFLRKRFIVRVTGDYAWEQGVQRFGVKDLIDEFQDKKYGWRVDFLRWAQKFAVKNASIVIAPSEYLRRLAIGWGADPEKVKVINNAVNLPKGSPSTSSGTKILYHKNFVIISAGRLVPWKGFEVLIQAVSELQKDIPEIKLTIVGSGPLFSSLRGLAKQSYNTVKIIDALPKTELAQQISGADIFILNTAYEGFSHQIVEAMSLGVPIITTNVGGNPEIIEDGENGLLTGYNDKEAIKNAILKLYKDRALAARLSQRGAEDVKKYSTEAMMDKLVNIL